MIQNISNLLWDLGELLFVSFFSFFWFLSYKYKSVFVYSFSSKKENKILLAIVMSFICAVLISLFLG